MSKLKTTLAVGVLTTALTGGLGIVGATTGATAASAATTTTASTAGSITTAVPVFERHRRWHRWHRWHRGHRGWGGRCVWFGGRGHVGFGHGRRHVRVTWSNGHWKIRRWGGCGRTHRPWWW